MDIYFNKYGVCTTQIYNGEIVRQGSTFNINVYFDEDFDDTDVLATISFLRPGDAAFSAEFNFDKSKLDYFTKQDNREISSDLVDGKQYRVFKYTTLDAEEITMYYGKLIALITIYRRGDIYVQSRVVVDVEPTAGNINKTITKSQYEYLATLQTKVSTALDEVLGEEESQKADQQLEKIVDTKKDIKNALEEKGQAPSKRFDTYANIIRKNLSSISGEVNITENGNYDVSKYASANVNVEQGVFPEGEMKITENGNYDVSNYASANVNIEQGVFPEGEMKITTTDSVDVTMYTNAKVEDDNLVPENIAKDVTILGITGTHEGGGSGEGITIPKVSNLVVDEKGLMTWNAPNLSSIEGFEPIITYVITVNSNVVAEVKTTSYDAKFDIISGKNVFGVIVKVSLTNDSDTSKTISYESELSSVSVLTATLEDKFSMMAAACVGDYVYIFGGYNGTTKERVNTIRQFDCLTETITTLETTLPTVLTQTTPYVYENKIHLVGGYTTGAYYNGHIIFDPSTLEVTTGMNFSFYKDFRDTTCVVVGQDLYTLGGSAYKNYTSTAVADCGKWWATNGNANGVYENAFSERFINAQAGYYNGEIYVISNNLISKRNITSNTTTIIGFNEIRNTCYAGGQVGNKIYLTSRSDYSNSIYEFDMETETMRKISKTMSIGRTRCASAIYNNTLYLFGGSRYANSTTTYFNLIEKITL